MQLPLLTRFSTAENSCKKLLDQGSRAETEFKVINTEIQKYSKTEINKENSCEELLDQDSWSSK